MATINKYVAKDGSISYRVQVRMRGAPPQTATFARLSDAKRWGAQVESAIAEGRYFKSTESRRHLFEEMIDRYLMHELPKKSAVMQKTQLVQLLWWKKQLGSYCLADITACMIAECRDKLLNDPKAPKTMNVKRQQPAQKRSNATVVRYMAALSVVYAKAVKEWEWMDQNPMGRVSKPQEPRGRVRYLSGEERERLLAACRTSKNDYLYPVVVLALSTGARSSEIKTLTWNQVDLTRKCAVLEETKNGERRVMHLAGHALEEISKLKCKATPGVDLLFPSTTRTSRPMDLRSAWLDAVERAGINDFRFHDLRHSAASYLAMNGATLAEIAEVLGHKTLSMVKRYVHLSDQHSRAVVERMNIAIF